ncbi:MAG: lysylphosphatidylglycerol synthase transmembrane domain-containing protein [Mycobacteriales bacterium]
MRRHGRVAVAVIAPVLLALLLATHWETVRSGILTIGRGDGEWLILAVGAAALTWAAASCCQLGSTTARLSVPVVFTTQVAGSFVNHVLPAGVGAAAINLRMLRRSGLSGDRAVTAVSLNVAAGMVLHLAALAVLIPLDPSSLRIGASSRTVLVVVAAVVLVGLIGLGVAGRRSSVLRGRLGGLAAEAAASLRSPRRFGLLWLGSAAVPALHIATLAGVLHAIGQPAPLTVIAVAYLAASALAALVPSPGGFGGLDVALLAALTTTGIASATAISAVIGYRSLTVWLPLVPGAGALLLLLRRRLI